MPPKHRQLNAPRPKPARNAFQALVDLPEDGSNSTFDGRDRKVDESDRFSARNTLQCAPSATPAASPPPTRYTTDYGESPVRKWRKELVKKGVRAYVFGEEIDCRAENILQYCAANATIGAHLEWLIEQRTGAIGDEMESAFKTVFDKLDNLRRQVDKMAMEEVALHKAYRQSTAETAALKATVDTLTKQINDHIALPALPVPDPTTSSTTMEEMTMQLSVVQNDIQDVLEAVRNPPGKRKRRGSDQNTGPTTPTNRRLATNKKRDASPEHSLMHSQHATSAAQDALDTLMHKYPPRPLAITSTEATTDPLPDSNAVQDTTLPDAPTTTAPAEKDGWKTVMGKAVQKKRRNDKADNERAATTASNTPKMKHGGRGKNTHQPKPTTPSAKKTWAEVVKSGGINVQIVLGNGNLGLATPPTKKRGERRGGAARRLGRKEGVGEKGEERRGKVGRPGAGGEEASTTGGGGERVEESGGRGGPAVV
jgi:regulator of replication initiation timing